MNDALFESLIAKPEGGLIDFKLSSYQFATNKDDEDAKFLKDILSFANTIRTESAYIIAGIKNELGTNTLVGITDMPDDAILQQKIKDKINPKANFSSYIFEYKGLKYGIIEIPVTAYTGPLMATVKLKGVEAGKVYLRRGSSNSDADGNEVIAINEWMSSLAANDIVLPQKRKYDFPDPYFARTVTPTDAEPIAYMFQTGTPLSEVFETHPKIALLAWGLNGKSTELRNLAAKLSTQSQYYPVLLSLGDHSDESIASRISEIDQIPPGLLVILLDGLDEVTDGYFEIATGKIIQFIELYPEAKIVVSCRTNFYTTVKDEGTLNTLTEFESFKLDQLSEDEINSFLDKFDPANKQALFDAVYQKQLSDLMVVPYYLIKLSQQFKDTRNIANNKAELFEEETSRLIKKDVLRNFASKHEIHEVRLRKLLQRLAFIMEAKGVNSIGTLELSLIFPNSADYDLVTKSASIFQGTDSTQKTWKFHHHNTQEYLTAQLLEDKSFSQVKKIIGIGPDYKRVKPSWVNTVSFLNSLLDKEDTLRRGIITWLTKYNTELLIKLEPEKLDNEVRVETFKAIFNLYKKKKRRINRTIYRYDDLAKFSEGITAFDFLLNELNATNGQATIANALEIINSYRLEKYPEYQESFKPIYLKILFDVDDSLHYIALVGYTSLFNLTKDEFALVFEKFKDAEDTWLRFQLFQAIWSGKHQEDYVDYILEQAKLLIKEDRRFSHERRNKNRLSNEYREIANCLNHLTSVKALIQLFTQLETEFVSFAHSTYFGKTLIEILKNVTQFADNAVLIGKINHIFLANHTYILHDSGLKESFLEYLRTANQVELICQKLFAKSPLKDASIISSISILATKYVIDFLLVKFKAGVISADNVDSLAHFLNRDSNPNEEYFMNLFDIPKKEMPIRDFEKEQLLNNQRNLAALFDKELYKNEIISIFDAFGKEILTYQDSYSYQAPDFWGIKFIYVAREALNLRPDQPDAVKTEIIKGIDLYFDSYKIDRIYSYMLHFNTAVLNEEQEKYIKDWCNSMAETVNFREAIFQQDPNSWESDTTSVMLSYFIRKLWLRHYRDDFYMGMLSFIKYDDTLIDIFEFVDSFCNHDLIVRTALTNLKSGIQNNRVLSNHLKFVRENKIQAAAPLLIQYLANSDHHNRHEFLNAYLDLGGDINALQDILVNSTSYFRDNLIEAFLKDGGSFIHNYLENQFNATIDPTERLTFSRYLIRLQSKLGLDFYIKYIKENRVVPDDSSPVNSLYQLRRPEFAIKMLDLFKLAQDPVYTKDTFKDLRTISITAFQNIALFQQNFWLVKRKLRWWLFSRKSISWLKREKTIPNYIHDIEFYWEGIEQQYYVNRIDPVSFAEAIQLYNTLTEGLSI